MRASIGLAVVVLAVASCGGHTSGANDTHSTGAGVQSIAANHNRPTVAGLHATGATDNRSTVAVLHAAGGCSSPTDCARYFRYRKAAAGGWQRTSVVAPTLAADGSVEVHQAVSGLQDDASYEYQVCSAASARHHGCVGPDGTAGTTQMFRTAIWTADATRSIDQEWAGYATGANCSAVTSGRSDPWVFQTRDATAPKGVAYRAVISQTGERPCFCSGSAACRSEIAQGLPTKTFPDQIDRTFHPGDDRWISFMVKLDPSYPTNPAGAKWNLWMQLKQLGGGISPTWAAGVTDGRWYLAQSTDNGTSPGSEIHELGSVRTGVWVRWTLHVIFNSDPSRGAITAWSDLASPGGPMLEVFNQSPTFTLRVGYGAHVRIGVYRDPVITGSTGVEYAGYTVASDRATAEGNAFSR